MPEISRNIFTQLLENFYFISIREYLIDISEISLMSQQFLENL